MYLNNSATDKCTCKCCSNGIVATIAVNLLLWTALIFSGGALIDCHMVEADIQSNDWPSLPNNLVGLTNGQATDRRGFGFFIHEDNNGSCRWEYWDDKKDNDNDWTSEDADEIEDYILDYVDWMGQDWRRASKLAIVSATFGLGLAVAAGIYACVSHLQWVRWLMGGLCILVVMPLQWGALAAVNSDFCKDRGCEMQRSGHFAIIAGFLYLASGACFFLMKNFPGDINNDNQVEDEVEKQQPPAMVLDEATNQDEEAVYAAGYIVDHADTRNGSEKNDDVQARLENVRID